MNHAPRRGDDRVLSMDLRRLAKKRIGSAFFRSDALRSVLTTKNYALSYYQAWTQPAAFQDVRAYCTFVGHMKSGGSMIGSMLDAHPNAILADEVDALHYVTAGFRRDQIFHILLRASQKEFQKGRITARRLTPYSWLVPGQWQGRHSTLRVIGDSATGISTERLATTPGLLERLWKVMKGVELKFIHVIRNPYDPISIMMLRGKRTFDAAYEHYFRGCERLLDLRNRLEASSVLAVRYEDFVHQPEKNLASICEFLGLEPTDDYLTACTGIVHESPEQARRLVKWEPRWIELVKERLAEFNFLAGYSFNG